MKCLERTRWCPRTTALIALVLIACPGAVCADVPARALVLAQADVRQQRIEACQSNNGIDCERQVDAELQAEAVQNPPSTDPAQASQALAQRRQQMIDDCEQNNGIDCATQVDTELAAEADPDRRHFIDQAPAGRIRAR